MPKKPKWFDKNYGIEDKYLLKFYYDTGGASEIRIVEYYLAGGALSYRQVADYPTLHGIPMHMMSSFSIDEIS